jgi:hypothetical protein
MLRKAGLMPRPSATGFAATGFAATGFAATACALALLLAAFPAGPAYAAESGEMRATRNAFYAQDGRAQQVPDKISVDEFPLEGDGAHKGRRSDRQKTGAARTETPNTEFWFYTVDVELFADQDLDGYFYGIDLYFDADTIYEQADVYAVLYLSREGGPWYEYAATDVFPLYGATSDDDFVVESELLSGWPTGSYDILIELYDTWDGAFVAEFGPEDSPELSFLPLEDADRDEPPDVIVVEEGGGAADPLTLAVFAVLVAGLAVRRRLRPATSRHASRRGP